MLGHFFPLRKAARIGRVQLKAGLAAVALCSGLLTQAAVADGTQQQPKAQAPAPAQAQAQYDTLSWAGLNWGLGIAADFDIGGTRVANASIVNGIVRLNDTSSNIGVSFVLEAHYFLKDLVTKGCNPNLAIPLPKGGIDYNCTEVAWGPFVAIEVGGGSTSSPQNNGPITAYALGWMMGLHHPKVDSSGKPDTTSWNLGVGLRIDPKAQVLGDGFAANLPPPNGETAIRYKTEPKAGVMVMSSFSF
jgi:hypothetical protein